MRLFTTFLIILARAFPPRIKVKTHFMERGSRVNHRRVNLNRTKRNLKLATTKISLYTTVLRPHRRAVVGSVYFLVNMSQIIQLNFLE